ncbi:MAG: hypothetical protein Q9207_006925 [Kuettlingeria erythrocarpa]
MGHSRVPEGECTAEASGKEKTLEPNSDGDTTPTPDARPQVFHGPFSDCTCSSCLEGAKKEAEKRFDNNTFAFVYIKKLEILVEHLQVEADANHQDEWDEPKFYRQGKTHRRNSIDSHRDAFDPTKRTAPAGLSRNLDALEAAPAAASDGTEVYQGPKVAIDRMRKTYDQHGNPLTRKDRTTPNAVVSVDQSNEYVLSIFREFDRKKNYWRRVVEIRSPAFIELLRNITHSNVDLPAPDEVLRLKEPLMPLFHNRTKLAERVPTGTTDSDEAAAQVKAPTKLILDFMENECQDVVKAQNGLAGSGLSATIQYEHAWLLYAPGTMVFSKENGEYEAFVIEVIRGCQKHQPCQNSRLPHSSMEIICWSINYDGEIFGRVWSTHYIAPFEGLKEVASMGLVPEAFVPNIGAVKTSLIDRGQKFWALRGQCFREYVGEVWSSQVKDDSIRVMVDHLTYQKRSQWPIEIDRKRGPANAQSKNWRENRFTRGRRATPPDDRFQPPPLRRAQRPARVIKAYGDDMEYSPDRYNNADQHEEAYERVDCDRPPQAGNASLKKYDVLSPESEPDELTKLLCPQIVHGYCMRDKVWKKLNVNQLRPVNFRKNAWERLVLDKEYKDIVQALVSSYVDKTAGLEDIIAGKGAGLVTLLHGPPGTGKTLTAECVAESFGKPLYQVTCGEIGTHSSMLEERLEEIFDDAVTWGAILVLDEADVFLQERDYENLERNALVSIFLRTLEYFNGILFLTTNRVGTFDQAFQSRIHITLGLPILDQPRRTEVWLLFLHEVAKTQRLTADQLQDLVSQASGVWSRQGLNGRQIRNSVRTALLVAEKKGEVVGKKHFDTVLRIGREFENYMNVLRKGEADVIAEVKGDRLADLGGFQEVERP